MEIEDIVQAAKEAIHQSLTEMELDEVRVRFLGKRSELTTRLKGLGKLSQEERPVVGAQINKA